MRDKILSMLSISASILALIWLQPVFAQGPANKAVPLAALKAERVRALVVSIRPNGFDPSSAVISDRKIMLIVRKAGGLQPHEFTIDRLGPDDKPAGRVKREQSPRNVMRWATALELQPGKYRLTETGTGQTFLLTVNNN